MTVSLTPLKTSDYEVNIYTSSGAAAGSFHSSNGVDSSKTIGVTSGQTYYIRVDVWLPYGVSGYKLRVSFYS